MINLKEWLSQLVKKRQSNNEIEIPDSVAFCTLLITKDDGLIISTDFKDGHEEAMAKLLFLLSSGVLMETMGNAICERCGEDIALRDKIVQSAYAMMMNNLEQDDEDEDDEDPVVDPCNVFKQNKPGITEDDLD